MKKLSRKKLSRQKGGSIMMSLNTTDFELYPIIKIDAEIKKYILSEIKKDLDIFLKHVGPAFLCSPTQDNVTIQDGGVCDETVFYIIPLILSIVTRSFIFNSRIEFYKTKSDDIGDDVVNNILLPTLSMVVSYNCISSVSNIASNGLAGQLSIHSGISAINSLLGSSSKKMHETNNSFLDNLSRDDLTIPDNINAGDIIIISPLPMWSPLEFLMKIFIEYLPLHWAVYLGNGIVGETWPSTDLSNTLTLSKFNKNKNYVIIKYNNNDVTEPNQIINTIETRIDDILQNNSNYGIIYNIYLNSCQNAAMYISCGTNITPIYYAVFFFSGYIVIATYFTTEMLESIGYRLIDGVTTILNIV